ncbi:MAG: hypothetical protein JNL08_02690 [Planctomycetes bacterium]|nr:hypothetical protein [Planctomycetota bacterium]
MALPSIPGLEWHPTKVPHAVEAAFTAAADATTVAALLRAIPRRGGLRFFDFLYHGEPPASGQPFDYGAIFCVYRRLRGDLFATCGNHGWSSPWTPVAPARLAGFLLGCLDSNRGSGPRSQTMLVEARASHVPRREAIDPRAPLFERRDVWRKWRQA